MKENIKVGSTVKKKGVHSTTERWTVQSECSLLGWFHLKLQGSNVFCAMPVNSLQLVTVNKDVNI